MRQDRNTPPLALDTLCREAGRQAQGWGPLELDSPPAWRSRRVAVVGCCLLAVVVALASFVLEPEDEAPGREDPALPALGSVLAFSATAGDVATAPARWEGDELVVDFEQVPLAQAVSLLAIATGTQVHGADQLKAPAFVTLHLRTREVPAAWQQLLQRHAAFSMSCSESSNCQVWVRSEAAGPTAAGAADRIDASAGDDRAGPAGASRDDMESQPDGSC
jgi:hypothetical protein